MIHLERYCGRDEDWDAVVRGFPGRTFFDGSRWLDAFARKTGEVRRYAFFQNGRCMAALSLGLELNSGIAEARSPYSAPFGGLLFGQDTPLTSLDACVQTLQEDLGEEFCCQGLTLFYVQRPRHVGMHPLHDLEEFVLSLRGFAVEDIQLEYFLELSSRQYSKTLRHELRAKARRFRFEPARMDEFLSFRDRVLPLQGKTKTLPDEEFQIIGRDFTEHVRVYKATMDGSTAAMLVSDELNEECAVGRNWFQDDAFSHCGATAFLVGSWLDDLAVRGFRRASFGGTATITGGYKPGMAFFKERFRPQVALKKQFVWRIAAR